MPSDTPSSPTLLEVTTRRLRSRRYSLRTEEAYLHWIRRFLRFHGRHPRDMGELEINQFLTCVDFGLKLIIVRNGKGSRRNRFGIFALNCATDLVRPIERNRRRSLAYVEDFVSEGGPKMWCR